jgi:hypothetical protein
MELPMIRALLLALALSLLADRASAQACVVQANGDCMLEPTAAEGQDSSPYSFQPGTARGNLETNYAVTGLDSMGRSHDFVTYLRFELPPTLLDPGETVTMARLLLYYAFTYAYPPDPLPTVPHPNDPTLISVHRVLSPWDENVLTWTNKPAYLGQAAAYRADITAFGVKEFIVTDLVRSWAHGTLPNYGFAVASPSGIPFGMWSWEAEPVIPTHQKARLRITVGPGGDPPAPIPVMPAWITALLVIAVATALALYMPRASGRS